VAQPDLDARFDHSRLERYLLAGELVIVAQRKHWAAIAEPFASAVAALLVASSLAVWLPPSFLTGLLFLGFAFLLGRALWKWTLWWRSWLVATDKRLLLNYGLIHEGVSMIALGRVVDLTYTRSTLGQLLGYGTLVRESSGHAQTLHEVRWVKDPDSTYLTICATIFGLEDRARGADDDPHGHRLEGVPLRHDPGRHGPYVTRSAGESYQVEEPSGIRIRYGSARRKAEQQRWRDSPDLGGPALGSTDTGQINYRRPATDASDDWTPTTDEDGVGHEEDTEGDSGDDVDDS